MRMQSDVITDEKIELYILELASPYE
jgi:hypothetical protein